MSKAKNVGRKKVKKDDHHFIILSALLLSSLVLICVLQTQLFKQSELISNYELLEKIDNQACRYLDNQPFVNGNFNLHNSAPADKPQLTYTCLTGEKTTAKEIHGKHIDAYEMGASVSYFSTNEAAEKFAEEKLNPLRYWGVDEDGQNKGIPQTSHFTFIVTDEKVPYFDAYTVKANAVLRVSLMCITDDPGACQNEAEFMLERELKGINVL